MKEPDKMIRDCISVMISIFYKCPLTICSMRGWTFYFT